jgi:hypothetical protein
MNKIFCLAILGLQMASSAYAWTYQDTDALLVFRAANHNDVEFDIGNISQFLNRANGYTTTVGGWTLAAVTNEFGSDLTGVSVILLATTPKNTITITNQFAWVSSASNVTSVADFRNSSWQSKLYSTIDALGAKPPTYSSSSLVVASSTNGYTIGTTSPAAYDIIVAAGGPINELGGNVPFQVEGVIPATFSLWAIQVSAATIIPNAAPVGNFTITAGGTLTFTANNGVTTNPNPPPPTILGITRSNNVTAVTFTTTTNTGFYQLYYTNVLGSPVTNWSAVGGTVAGNLSNQTLTHTNAGGTGFYNVQWSP